MDIYNLKILSEHIYADYECFTNFSFMDNDFKIEILTKKGKKYGFSFNIVVGNSVELKQWMESIPNQFRDMLVKEALGKTQYYSDNVRDYNICQCECGE